MTLEWLALTPAAAAGEAWRLWTGHLAHWSASHLALNAAALTPVAVVLWRRWRTVFVWVLLSAPLISAAILITTRDVEYRGASALAAGLWIMAGVELMRAGSRRAGATLLLLVTLKVVIESPGLFPQTTEVQSSVVAHWTGVMLGACACGGRFLAPRRLGGRVRAATLRQPSRLPPRLSS